jgi:solute carrier family 35 protein F1/2
MSSRRHVLLVLCGWQFISLLLASSSVFAQNLALRNLYAPALQSALLYSTLLVVYGSWKLYTFAYSSSSSSSLSIDDQDQYQPLAEQQSNTRKWILFVILAATDVEGNFLVVSAFKYTNLLSVQLLDCAAVPIVMILSKVLLATRFTNRAIAGATICIAGLVGLVLTDAFGDPNFDNGGIDGSQAWKGDLLVIFGAVCYALSNVLEEKMVRSRSITELLFRMGLLGTIISVVQALALGEFENLIMVFDGKVAANLAGFTACMFGIYSIVPRLLLRSSATVMNLSYLTSDFWSLLAASVLFSLRFNALFFVCFAVIILGIIIYHSEEIFARR